VTVSRPPPHPTPPLPPPPHTQVQGSDAVIEYVKSTPNSISYVSYDHVMRENGTIRCLAMSSMNENNNNSSCLDVVEPSTESVTKAIDIAWSSTTSVSWNYTHGIELMSSDVLLDFTAWPISSFTYIALRLNSSREIASCSKRENVLAFLDWVYNSEEAQSYALKNGFIPLPEASRQHAIDHVLTNMRCQDGTRVALSNVNLLNVVQNLTLQNASTTDDDNDSHDAYCQDVKMIGEIPVEFNTPDIPSRFSLNLFLDAAFISIAILLEHLSNLRRYAEQGEYVVNTKQDFLSLGLTNVVGSIFGSFACGAGFSRSAVNMDAGAKSQMSLLLSGFVVSFF
jgi:hypothetical protein